MPIFFEKASGPFIWDIDGNRYIDYLLGYGSVVLGHADAEINAAVVRAVSTGVNPALVHPNQVELAEKIIELIPSAELVTFLKTGSDAASAAVRLARAITGRETVVYCGHHGWHDWCATKSPGVLVSTKSLTHAFKYNDTRSLEVLMSKHGNRVACVVMMPYEIEAPLNGFLREVQEIARSYGSLFILDEIRSGFRIALGGAQSIYELEPDLATFSKAMANGHAISALVGKQCHMRHILKVGLTVTFYRSLTAITAALATIRRLECDQGPNQLSLIGRKLMNGIDQAAKRAGVPAQSVGMPSTPFLKFSYENEDECDRALRIFCNGMLKRGVLMPPSHHWFVCTSMTDKVINDTICSARDTFDEIARQI